MQAEELQEIIKDQQTINKNKNRDRLVLALFFLHKSITMNNNLSLQTNDVCELNRKISELEKKVTAIEEVLEKMSACFKGMPSYTMKNVQESIESYTPNTQTVDESSKKETYNNDSSTAYAPQTQCPSVNEECEAVKIELRYLGAPSGSGFEIINERSTISFDTLYILEIDRANGKAKFYPNVENLTQMVQSRNYYIDPVCDIEGSLDNICSFNISRENYGELILDNDYWQVTKKFLIKC